jgi:hypothetical protein
LLLIVILGVLVVGIVVAVLVGLMNASKNRRTDTSASSAVADRTLGVTGPTVSSFHVAGDTAITTFGAPLGTAEPGQHLVDLLSLAAVEFLHAKQKDGLPLSEVSKIDVRAMRGAEPESISIIDLPNKGQLPLIASMRTVAEPVVDPIGEMAKVVADSSVVATPTTAGDLPSVASFIQLGGPTEASLRAMGVDTSNLSLHDLVVGLFQVSGYEILDGRTGASGVTGAETFRLVRSGKSTSVVLLPHVEGSYPEIGDTVFTELAIAAGQVQGDDVIFISDKFAPYSMYERERRDKRILFVTRERLQGFVDSFGLG